jgi:opacity protein-like surface antigen
MRLSVWAVGIAAIVASGSAFAADLDLPTHRAPPPPSAFGWTGFYAGGYAG